jgi:hypothetical protein
MKRVFINLIVIAILSLSLSACWQANADNASTIAKKSSYSTYVDKKGNISRPKNFRENWVHLGSWYVSSDGMNSGSSMHDVYAEPEAVSSFVENGQWPDGAVLVKTVSSIKSEKLTTGLAQWANEIDVWFVMVRDRHNRFPDNRAWGEGWGWALFQADSPDKNLTVNWKGEGFNNCFGCHAPVKNSEWVYIDGYPTVRDSKKYPN